MKILFVISILSFLLLLWSSVAVTRRIRNSHKLESSSPQSQPDFSQYLFAASEAANAPSQSVQHQTDQDPAAPRIHFNDKATSPKRG